MIATTIGNIVTRITKGTTPTTLGGRFVDHGVNFIKSEAISYDGRIDRSTFAFIDEDTHEKLKRSQIEKHDILFSMAGIFLGKNAVVTEQFLPANTNQALAIIRVDKKKADPYYVHYYLRQPVVIEHINNMSGQSAQPNINMEEIGSIEISLPPIDEQHKIVNVLRSLDDKIDLLHRNNKTLEEMAEVMYLHHFVNNNDDSLQEIALDECGLFLNGLALQKYPYLGNGGSLPVIKIREMNSGITENTDQCSDNIPPQYVVENGDILFSWSGSLELMFWNGGKGALNQHLFKVTSDAYPSWFLYFSIKHHLPFFRDVANDKATTMGHIQRKHLTQALVKVPQSMDFRKYDSIFSPIVEKIKMNNLQVVTLRTLRDTLLPKLMSGQVRVKDI